MTANDIQIIFTKQQTYFQTAATLPIHFRMLQLKILRRALDEYEDAFYRALENDFRKPRFETFTNEILLCRHEIDFTIKHLARWTKPRPVRPHLLNIPSSDTIMPQPRGVTLVLSPWNYPVQLSLIPVVGAIAAGNCCILKPSELSPNTSNLLHTIISQKFSPEHVAVVEGGVHEATTLLNLEFDTIFFTGSPQVGKIVMQAAAKNLIPVTLELGGKNPCIVEQDADITLSARRIAWGKFLNAGQTCVAPDYLYVHQSILDLFMQQLKKTITGFYGASIIDSPDYARMISVKHFQRIAGMIQPEKVVFGGHTDEPSRYIEPTILYPVTWEDPVMQDEIFGPVLPILPYSDINDVLSQINHRPKPLALYLFATNRKRINEVLTRTSSGGAAINETIVHLANPRLPFGGVGTSGMGASHGKTNFDAFTHYRSVLKKPWWGENTIKYPPYRNKLDLLKRLVRWL
jgi:aldehyde dehydrogenase (NAD+)